MHEVQQQPSGGIDLVEEDGVTVLRLCGEVDSLVVEAWDAGGPRTPGAGAVDLSAATFLDGRALRLLVRETEQARRAGELPELRRPSPLVRRMLEVTGAAVLFAAVC
ncbi:STAS domain-containing protein [Modestobacter sp. VKM Ac-2977]|uniref:STAS domain-containing protein n=1 Tax=Modestobacter sp. VKM Ac-2977 TaxID=3004131 RepID=UPI0022AA1E45|nr:STAS domain-containing protein [Modestobacter sp. VKM Ac-2977]MCZ2820185.1 STAS domain-containing protein [Modestobacter sp. VKM Ac-2977]